MQKFLFADHEGLISRTPDWGQRSMAAWAGWMVGTGSDYADPGVQVGKASAVVRDYVVAADGPTNIASPSTNVTVRDSAHINLSERFVLGFAIVGTDGDDRLLGTDAGDELRGLDGEDQLWRQAMGEVQERCSIDLWSGRDLVPKPRDRAEEVRDCGSAAMKRGTPAESAARHPAHEWAYVFGAVCPARAAPAGLVMPFVDTPAMNVTLRRGCMERVHAD